MTLEELILECKKQQPKAQELLYKKYSKVLFGVCLKYSPNYQEAEDSLQDAFITIFNKIDQFKSKGSFEGWLKRITVNTVLQKYRKQKVFKLTNEEQIEDKIEEVSLENSNIVLNDLLTMIQELPNQYRLVFTLYVLDDYSHKEISEMLGISVGTSKSNLSRARQLLITKVEQYENKKTK